MQPGFVQEAFAAAMRHGLVVAGAASEQVAAGAVSLQKSCGRQMFDSEATYT